MTRFFSIIHHFYTSLDLLFPPHCASCKNPGYRFCPECTEKSAKIRKGFCARCGNPLFGKDNCYSCGQDLPPYQEARAWGLHEGRLREAVHQLKYRRDIALGESLAKLLNDLVVAQPWNIDIVLPVPLGRKRLRERGYNQANLLAYPLAWYLGKGYSAKALIREKETRTQIGLNRLERRENVRNAFLPDSNKVRGKTILLVDDVITTGATLNSAASSLLDGGAEKVYAVALARATSLWHK